MGPSWRSAGPSPRQTPRPARSWRKTGRPSSPTWSDASRGATIFHTRHLTCTQCHIAGTGTSPLGPNLTALPEDVPRDRLTAHLVESLLDPSAVIRPAYHGVTIITDEGKSLSGIMARETADELVLRDAATGGLETTIPKASIERRIAYGSEPHAMYRTLTTGNGLTVAQTWMVPSQKYDVIHYIRETFLKDRNPAWYAAITPDYLASLPKGSRRGPEPSTVEPWRMHDYGPFLAGTFEVGKDGTNIARKGLAVRLDDGAGGVAKRKAWILYELDTLRAAAFWTGDRFIDWTGIHFDGRHGQHPHVPGDVQATVATMPGWADSATGSFANPRPLGRDGKPYGPLPRGQVKLRAAHHAAASESSDDLRSAVVLDFTVGTTPVLENIEPRAAPHSRGLGRACRDPLVFDRLANRPARRGGRDRGG